MHTSPRLQSDWRLLPGNMTSCLKHVLFAFLSSRGSAAAGRGSVVPIVTLWTSVSTEGTPVITGGRVSPPGTTLTAVIAPRGTRGPSAPSWPVLTRAVYRYRVGGMECALTRAVGCTACARRGLSGDAVIFWSTTAWLIPVLMGAAETR